MANISKNTSRFLYNPSGLVNSSGHQEEDESSTPKDEEHLYWLVVLVIVAEHMYALISLIGIVANTVNSIIFYRIGLGDRMTICLFSLALVDQLFLLTYFHLDILSIVSERPLFGFGEEHWLTAITYGLGVHYSFRTTSSLYTMVISIERCVCVAFPLRSASLINRRTTAVILGLLAVLPQLGFVCQPLKYNVIKTEVEGRPHWQLVSSQLYLAYGDIMDIIIYAVFSVSVPLITFFIVSLATFITIIHLAAASAWRRKRSSSSIKHCSQQVALTKMLVFASCVYIVSMVPFISLRIVRFFVEEFSANGIHRRIYTICNSLANGGPVINSSMSFWIYYSRSSRYRKELQKVGLCRNCCTCESLKNVRADVS